MKTLIDMLALDQIGEGLFSGWAPDRGGARIFGGAAVAQALLAAYETVDGRVCHSLHCYFIHLGDPAQPMIFAVDRTRDGGSFATRHVTVTQGGRPILEMLASFQRPAAGYEHQSTAPDVVAPESLGDDDRRGEAVGLQLRNLQLPRPGSEPTIRSPTHRMWFRSEQALGEDIRHHQAALAYASDFPQLPTIVQPHPVTWATPGFQYASLDHAIWFHRPLDFTAWHLCDMETPSSSDGRGISRATVYSRNGVLVATIVQEAMIRMSSRTA